ncbi:MAG: CBS domain-containing protein [Sedimentisphaerales bacterium]
MTKSFIYVKPDTSLCKAMEMLIEHNISGIPVVDDDMTLVAIISEKDVLESYADFEHLADKSVCDFMTQPAIFFEENESATDVWRFLVNHDFRRVPVTSRGRLVGIISRRDIIKKMLKEAHLKTASVGS